VSGPLLYLRPSEYRRQLEVNMVSPLLVIQAFAPLLGTDKKRQGPQGASWGSQFTPQHRSPRLDLRSEKTELYFLADVATLGFAISLMTSASVALSDCFFVFLLPIPHDFTSPGASSGQFGSMYSESKRAYRHSVALKHLTERGHLYSET
jgi:NAD(P)-dependent dehydrogenase (short-subunit alcohol dehydrogenase family)